MDRCVAEEKFRQSGAPALKQVVVLDPNWSHQTLQSFYLTEDRKRVKPNVVIVRPPCMDIVFQTNAYGFKGGDIDPSRKPVAVWGDSVVFSIGEGWVSGLDDYFPGFQFLNGGLEGDELGNICQRAVEINRLVRLHANVIFPGWHTRKDPNKVYALLLQVVQVLPCPILCTVPLSLSLKTAGIDLSPYFDIETKDIEKYYGFAGTTEYSIKNALQLVKEFVIQNKLVIRVAQERRLPLVDLYKHFYTEDINSFRQYFFDIGHPRPSAFKKIQQVFHEELKDVII